MSGAPGRREPPYRAPGAITYWVPRRRSVVPAVLVGVVLLGGLVSAQAAVGLLGGPTGPGPGTSAPPVAAPVASAAPSVASPPPTAEPPTAEPPTAEPPTAEASPGRVAEGEWQPEPAVVELAVGAVVDGPAVAAVDDLAEALRAPGAAPVLLEGVAAPGPDEAAAAELALLRADAVRAALEDRGVPAGLLRTTGVVSADGPRGVRVRPLAPATG